MSSAPLHHHAQLPLRLAPVVLQGDQQELTLTAGEEETTGQLEELAMGGDAGTSLKKLILLSYAGLVS